jgi:hypothetical protein
MTIQELKEATLKHVSADWVRENFGKLTLKATWEAVYDRTHEYAAAVKEQADQAMALANEIKHQAPIVSHEIKGITTELATEIHQSRAATITRQYCHVAFVEVLKLLILGYLMWLEWRESGAIAKLLAEVAELEHRRKLEACLELEFDPALIIDRPILAHSWRLSHQVMAT